ncbi:MAG: acyl-CoA dehydrogenase [Mycobacteriales bacterium]
MTTAAELQALLDGPHAGLREDTRRRLCTLGLERADGLPRDAYRDLVLAWLCEVGRSGDGARSFPASAGGRDDPGGRIATFQTTGHSDLSLLVKMGVQFGLFGGAVHRLGTDKHVPLLRDIGTVELPGCFAMSESGHGSDVRSIRTQARYDPEAGEFVIHTPDETARKDWIGGAARHARMAAVFAQLDVAGQGQGVHCFLVPLRDEAGALLEGVVIEHCGDKMGLQGVDNGRIRFHAVRVPGDNLLDRFGTVSPEGVYSSPVAKPAARFFTMIGALVEGRICIAGAGLSVARNALTIAVRWGERRRQFGTGLEMDTPLMDYLTHQRRLLPPVCESYVLQAAHDHLTARYVEVLDGGDGQRDVEALAAGLKAVATWHMVDAVQQSRECCGGKGYLAENRFAALRADSDVFVTFEGDNTVLMQLVAKTLLSDYAAQFEDLDALGLVRHLGSRQATGVLSEFSRRFERTALLDPTWQLDALRFREERLVDSLARRLRTLTGREGMDPLRALARCQDHALAAARAHIERQAHELFQPNVSGDLLASVRDLAALWAIERDRAWWLEHGFLSPDASKDLQKQVNTLCRELRPHALTLVGGFGIPDALLRAPIAVAAPRA